MPATAASALFSCIALSSFALSSFALSSFALLSLALASLGIAGCGPADPLPQLRAQQEAGDLEGTLAPLRELLAERPDDAELHFLYGRALVLTGQPSLAEWSLRKAMEDPEWLVRAGLQFVPGTIQLGNYSEAIAVTGRILAVEPENLPALLLRANAYAQGRVDFERALADADRILELDPDNLEAMQPRILALLGLDRIPEAAEAIQALGERIDEIELSPGLAAWHCATAAIFADEGGNAELAAERWADCTDNFPAYPNVVQNAVQFYDARGEPDRSQEILRHALDEAPASRDFRTTLAYRLRLEGRNEEALALLSEATETEHPGLAVSAWIDLAQHHDAVGDFAAAAQAAGKAVQLSRGFESPELPQMLLAYADALVLSGALDRALEVAGEMTVAAHRELILARVAQERDQRSEALAHFEESARLWPNNAFGRYYSARAAEAVGDFERAIEAYRYAIRIDAGAADARVRVARLLAADGKPAEGLLLLRTLGDQEPPDLEGEILAIRLAARAGEAAPLLAALGKIARSHPDRLGRAAASAAAGVREAAGPAAAVAWLRGLEGVDLEDPRHAEALRALVRFSREAGRPPKAEPELRAALRAHPDSAVLREIEALRLELGGAPEEEVRAAYARAVELDPGSAYAAAGLARLVESRDPQEALRLFDLAAKADPSDLAARLAAARILRGDGKAEAAEERLEALLEEHPYAAAAAMQLVEIQLERGPGTDRTVELASRALRFGGGADAAELLGRVYTSRNEPERATEATARARALREEGTPLPGAPPRDAPEARRTSPRGEPPSSGAAPAPG